MPNPHCIGIKNKTRSKSKFLKRFFMSSRKKKVVVCQPLPSFLFFSNKIEFYFIKSSINLILKYFFDTIKTS